MSHENRMEECRERLHGLHLSVADLMTRDPMTLLAEDNLMTLQDVMSWKNVRHVPVVDASGKLVGLVTQRDLLRVSISDLADVGLNEKNVLSQQIPLKEVMRTNLVTVGPKTDLGSAAVLLTENKIGCLPIVDANRKLLGILTEADFVKLFVDWSEE